MAIDDPIVSGMIALGLNGFVRFLLFRRLKGCT